jgi:DNA-binding response OmpR family regulator
MAREKILLVDDEVEITDLIKKYLLKEDFTVNVARNAHEALEEIHNENPDLIILDIMLPDIDGIELCLEIRKLSNAPVLFLSCKSEEIDKVMALSVGGDDYISKPFLPGELIARIKAHLRRNRLIINTVQQDHVIQYPGIEINIDTHEVRINNELVNLSNKEFEILSILIKNPKRIYSMEQLFQMVWKMDSLEGDARTIMVYISNLRKKIELDPSNPQYIVNVRGVGYKFNHALLQNKTAN